ncbi:MAG: response regulator [Deltaproteobacteria bacterium]|nr:response regulator [Deltaproteobacteria bacterium]
MIKNVLLVDDDRTMLLALEEGFARYSDSFSVRLAGDGIEALEYLKRQPVSLVVTDLKMPRMDGFELLATIMANYPDIPVIIITGYSTPEMERLARKGGAVAFVAKPFLIENLALQIVSMLRQEADGGTLHNVSSGVFLQLIEMEQKTCTIRLEEKTSGEQGVLFFVEGELRDARVGERQGEIAAYEIFAWDNISLSIQNGCTVRQNRINKELSALLIEGARRSDELKAQRAAPHEEPPRTRPESSPDDVLKGVRLKIERTLGLQCGVEDVIQDERWTGRIHRISQSGERLKLGKLALAYIDQGDSSDYLLLPGDHAVVTVNPKCPRDKLLQLLGE